MGGGGGLGQFIDLRGGGTWQESGRVVFLRVG